MWVCNQFSSVAQACLTFCDPMGWSKPSFPVHHQLLEFAQTHVHQGSDAIEPSHPLSSRSPPAFDLSQHQGIFPMNQFFASGGQSIETSASSSVLPMNIQYWPVWSPCGPRDSQESSPAPQFKSISTSVFSFLYGQLLHPYMTTGKNRALTRWTSVSKVMSLLFNMLSRFVIAFLPRRKCLNFWASVTICNDFRAPKIKSLDFFYCFHLLFAIKWWNQMPWS